MTKQSVALRLRQLQDGT